MSSDEGFSIGIRSDLQTTSIISDSRHAPSTESWFKINSYSPQNRRLTASLSDLTSLVSRLGVEGPRHLQALNVRDTHVRIGQGSQFDVFGQDPSFVKFETTLEAVIKRVRLPRSSWGEDTSVANSEYSRRLRHIELEILSLCHPKLRGHRNIVRLIAWGYDYDDRQTALPVLFMEAARMSLSEALKEPNRAVLSRSTDADDVKYHIALDVAAGLEALHTHKLVHGDVKPDNILLFPSARPDIPWVAKLSDFGLCIEIQRQEAIDSYSYEYNGTQEWVGPEVDHFNEELWGKFDDAELFFKYDAYSFGLVLLSMFATQGRPPFPLTEKSKWNQLDLTACDAAEKKLDAILTLRSYIKDTVKKALRCLLFENPRQRSLPSLELLRGDHPVFNVWFEEYAQLLLRDMPLGYRDPLSNRGADYWFGLDDVLLEQLDEQFTKVEKSRGQGKLSGETLFGMAQRYGRLFKPEDLDKMLSYLLRASKEGHSPAQAICASVFRAQRRPLDVNDETLREWHRRALREGFLFLQDDWLLSSGDVEIQRCEFRKSGGYCTDAFMRDRNIRDIAGNVSRTREWIQTHEYGSPVDHDGNLLLHVCAVMGHIESVEYLIQHHEYAPGLKNNAGENPLYKACQAGNFGCAKMLLEQGERAEPIPGLNISPLHWLFVFPEKVIPQIANALVCSGKNDVNCTIHPEKAPSGSPRPIHSLHYPFQWPFGTPLHWAAFARSTAAMETLLSLGADIDATYSDGEALTTPLAQAVHLREAEVVSFLISHGARTCAVDSAGRNILHKLSDSTGRSDVPDYKFSAWIRQGTWKERFKATTDVVNQLLEARVDIEARTNRFDNLTPLLEAACMARFQECAAFVLLSAGADVNVATSETKKTILHHCAETDRRKTAYPEGYDELFRLSIEKTQNLDAPGRLGTLERSPLHIVAESWTDLQQFEHKVVSLVRRSHSPATINVLDSDGCTPLMQILRCIEDDQALDRSRILLHLGANPRITGKEGRNILFAITDSNRRMDAQCHMLLESLILACKFNAQDLADFVNRTNLRAFLKPCYHGKLETVRYLLKLGFDRRINEMASGWQTVLDNQTALDHAFFGAHYERRYYLKRASQYRKEEDLKKAIQKGTLLSYFGKNPIGQPRSERLDEAYETFPDILRLLIQHCAHRNPNRIDDEGPSYIDAVQAPEWGFTAETQPRKDHWQVLYELEQRGENWEEETAKAVRYIYEDDGILLVPPVLLFDRWPGDLASVLKPDKEGWYQSSLRNLKKVKVKLEDGKVSGIKDWDGKPLPRDMR